MTDCKKIADSLKILSKMVGVLLTLMGISAGIIGVSPGGVIESELERFVGLIALAEGVLYFVPNSTLTRSNSITISYLIVTLIPAVCFVGWAILITITKDFSYFLVVGGAYVLCILTPLSMLAPLSLIYAKKHYKRRDGTGNAINI